MDKAKNLDQGARELAILLDEGNEKAVAERLRSDIYQMKPDELTRFVEKVSGYEKKGTGLDVDLKNGYLNISNYDNAFYEAIGWQTTRSFSKDLGTHWTDGGFNRRWVNVGTGARDRAKMNDEAKNKGRFIEQQP